MTPSQLDQIKKEQRRSEAESLRTRSDYKEIVEALAKACEVLPPGVDLSKGGLGELALAYSLGHELIAGDKGADARDDKFSYEYKISTTNQFNFNFNARRDTWEESAEVVKKHFVGIEGAYCAQRNGMDILEVAYVPTSILLPYLLEHFQKTTGKMMNKNFRIKPFEELNNV